MDKPRKHNVVINFLSILEHTTKREMTNDVFLDEHLFVVSITTLGFADIANYLGNRDISTTFHLQAKIQDY